MSLISSPRFLLQAGTSLVLSHSIRLVFPQGLVWPVECSASPFHGPSTESFVSFIHCGFGCLGVTSKRKDEKCRTCDERYLGINSFAYCIELDRRGASPDAHSVGCRFNSGGPGCQYQNVGPTRSSDPERHGALSADVSSCCSHFRSQA